MTVRERPIPVGARVEYTEPGSGRTHRGYVAGYRDEVWMPVSVQFDGDPDGEWCQYNADELRVITLPRVNA